MGEAEKKNMLASLQDQSCLGKSTSLKPFSFMDPPKPFRGVGSSFQEWQEPLETSNIGDAEGSTNPKLDLNLSFDQAENDLISGSFATPSSGVNFNNGQTYEGQANEPDLDLKLATEILEADPKKLKRVMANRVYSKKYRLKKMLYIDHMEKLTNALRIKTANIRLQIEENKNMQRSLLLEQHQLKLQIAAYEKDRIVKEVETAKNIAEANRLRELQINQLKSKEHPVRNSDAGVHTAELDLNL